MRRRLLLSVAILVLGCAVAVETAFPGADSPRSTIVAASGAAASAFEPDGRRGVELPWLMPGDGDVAVAPDRRRIAFVSERDGNPEIYVVDARTGVVRRLTVNLRADDRRPAWSPNGRRLVWQSGRPGDSDLFVMDADGGRKRALVPGRGDARDPAWSPDGRAVAFSSNRGGRRNLWLVPASGGEPELLAAIPGRARAPSWSPDGRRIAFSLESAGSADLWVVDVASLERRRVTRGGGWDADPDWSSDGQRLAFSRAAGGVIALYTVGADGGRPLRVAGATGYRDPDWADAAPVVGGVEGELLPDLDQQSPRGLVVVSSGGRFRLGFASATESRGEGPLVIRGVRPPGRQFMRAHQVIEGLGGGTRVVLDVGALEFERHPPHFHWHFQDFVRYELRRASDFALVARDRKTGFCLVDRYGRVPGKVPGTGPPRFVGDCGASRPLARRVEEGSSVGYVDRYPALFHGQDVDLTAVPAGTYVLVHRANPDRALRELRYSNNDASLLLELRRPGGPGAAPEVRVLRRCEARARCLLTG